MDAPVQLEISRRRVLAAVLVTCLAVEGTLFLLDAQTYAADGGSPPLRRLFNITREDGLAGWFGPVQTLMLALTCWAVWAVKRHRQPGRGTAGWPVVASFFTYLAVDDGSKLHERLGTAAADHACRTAACQQLQDLLGAFPSYAWQFLFLPALSVLAAFTLVFLWFQLGDRLGRLLLLAGIGFLTLAVAMDFVEGLAPRRPDHPYQWVIDRLDLYRASRRHFGRAAFEVVAHFSKAVEETLELLGTTLLWLAVLRHLMSGTSEVRLRFRPS